MTLTLFLQLVAGLCWSIAYIEIIRLGFKQKTYGMPLFALALNFSWEIAASIKSFINPSGVDPQGYINLTWCLIDVLIFYTYFRYGYQYFPKQFGRKGFIAWSLLSFVCGLAINYAFICEFNKFEGIVLDSIALEYTAALSNVLMSVLFIDMFVRRKGMEGQSITIGVSKWIGTFSSWLTLRSNPLIFFTGPLCFIFDAIYVTLLVQENLKNAQNSEQGDIKTLNNQPQTLA